MWRRVEGGRKGVTMWKEKKMMMIKKKNILRFSSFSLNFFPLPPWDPHHRRSVKKRKERNLNTQALQPMLQKLPSVHHPSIIDHPSIRNVFFFLGVIMGFS